MEHVFTLEQKEKHYTVKEASRQLGIDYSTINHACKEGRIIASVIPSPNRVGCTTYLISETELTKWYVESYKSKQKPQTAEIVAINTNSLADVSVKELFAELKRRFDLAYDEGYAKGRKDAKAEFMKVFRNIE